MKKRMLMISSLFSVYVGCFVSTKLDTSAMRDHNHKHLKHANCIAKDRKLALPKSLLSEISQTEGLVSVESNHAYTLATMTHSKPYLTPNAKNLLDDIGHRFQKKLKSKGYQSRKLRITSLTRSQKSQIQLSKGNANAAKNSAHLLGSTIDISYARFPKGDSHIGISPSYEVLVDTLEQTLLEFRDAKRLVGIKEYRQKCFHITLHCPSL
ncbi:MAG: DUF5715 family protein [Myxococcota bacterium]|nr:DUF5715 family protein [Myxococcota bacterium]